MNDVYCLLMYDNLQLCFSQNFSNGGIFVQCVHLSGEWGQCFYINYTFLVTYRAEHVLYKFHKFSQQEG